MTRFSSDPHTLSLSPSLCLCSSSILPKMVLLNCSSYRITPGQDIFCLPLQTCSILLLALGTDLDGPQQWPPPWLLASSWIWPKGSTTRRSKGKKNEVGVFIAPHGGVSLSCSVSWSLLVTAWTTAHQAPLSTGLSKQECWSGLPFPPPGDLSSPGTEPMSPMSPALAFGFFTTEPSEKPKRKLACPDLNPGPLTTEVRIIP